MEDWKKKLYNEIKNICTPIMNLPRDYNYSSNYTFDIGLLIIPSHTQDGGWVNVPERIYRLEYVKGWGVNATYLEDGKPIGSKNRIGDNGNIQSLVDCCFVKPIFIPVKN